MSTVSGKSRAQTLSIDLIKTIGVINTSVKCNDWPAEDINVTVVEDGHRPNIGRDSFQQIGLSLMQTKQLLDVDQNQCLIKKQIALDFPGLTKSFNHTVKTTFNKHCTNPLHQKGVPINNQLY